MTADEMNDGIGPLLRYWRKRRRLTQMDLSLNANVSARHLSFVETGRSLPTREMIFRLAETLDVPLRDRNRLLLSAGLAPAYSQELLGGPSMAVVNDAIERILSAHMPFPAVVIDANWELVAANDAITVLTEGVAASLLEPPVNVLRLTLHPDGLSSRIINFVEWRAHIINRLQRDIKRTASNQLIELQDELQSYPSPGDGTEERDSSLIVPLLLRARGRILSLFSTTTVFATPNDVTVSELAIESFYPDDEATREYFVGRT